MPSVEEIAMKYASQLTELRNNSKPLINSLTMMAEDHIRNAKVIVETIENHLIKVDPEYKLPILYLIDSIVKNVKKDYVPLFSENIATTFTQAFAQVKHVLVPDKIRTQLFKLRQTWNEVFPTKLLYSIDVKCHRVDPGWPITAAAPSSAQIHVNPKFIQRALTNPSTSSSPLLAATISSPPMVSFQTGGGIDPNILALTAPSFTNLDPPGDITEAQMREQLLMKQKELLELQTKKLELELLHTKAQLDARTRKQVDISQTKQQSEVHQVKQQQLQIQAELAKTQTDLAASILSKVPSNELPVHLPAEVLQDPRKRRNKDKDKHDDSKSKHHKHETLPDKSHARLPTSDQFVINSIALPTLPILSNAPNPLVSAMMSQTEVWTKRSDPQNHYKRDEKRERGDVKREMLDMAKRDREELAKREEAIRRERDRERDEIIRREREREESLKRERDELIKKEKEDALKRERDEFTKIEREETSKREREREEMIKRDRERDDMIKRERDEGKKERDELMKRERTPLKDTHKDKEYPSPSGSSGSHRSRLSPSNSPTKGGGSGSSHKSISPAKEHLTSSLLSDPRKRKRAGSKSHEHSSKSRDSSKEKDRHGSGSSRQPSIIIGVVNSEVGADSALLEVPSSKRRKKSSEDSSSSKDSRGKSKDKDITKDKNSRSGSSKTKSSSRHRRDSESTLPNTKNSSKDKDWERKDNYNARKTAVLKKSYRRATEVSKMLDEEEEMMASEGSDTANSNRKDKENHQRGRSNSILSDKDAVDATEPTGKLGADVDLRYEARPHLDVDLRGASRSPKSEKLTAASDIPSGKKSRNGNLIDDLFGREDVDLRQHQSTPQSSNWAQVKKPSVSDLEMPMPIGKLPLLKEQNQDEDIRDIMLQQQRPPPAISPANSVDSNRSTCDPLGRPLLYNRLPDDPTERKRSLDSRASIDPVERFRSQFIEEPSMGTGHLKIDDLKKAVSNAQQQFEMGFLNVDQHALIMRQLMQINEVNKIRDVQMQQGISGAQGHNPWTDSESNDAWSQFSNRGPPEFANQFAGPNPWGAAPPMGALGWGQQQPPGPNPFEEAAAAAMPLPMTPDNILPPVSMMELDNVRKDTAKTIPIDKALRQVRFYAETAIVLQGDEPREISFHKGIPKNVFINNERDPVRCFIGKTVLVYLNRKKCNLKLGAPTRELYIDGEFYEALFGGPPVRVQFGRHFHSFKLEGPPPQVEMGKVSRYDLLAGRVNLVIDGNITTVFLDYKSQLLDLCGFPVVLKFRDNFHTVLLNGQAFPTDFGGNPMTVTVPSGRKHYLRFTTLSQNTIRNMNQFIRARGPGSDSHKPPISEVFGFGGGNFRGGRGIRGNRGGPSNRGMNRPPLFNMPPMPIGPMGIGNDPMGIPLQPQLPQSMADPFHPSMTTFDANPLDVLANIMPVSDAQFGGITQLHNSENSYVSINNSKEEEEEKLDDPKGQDGGDSVNVQDLLSKLMMAGLLPAADSSNTTSEQDTKAEKETDVPTPAPKTKSKKKPKVEKVIPPLETVDVPLDKLKERRDKLIAQICTGVQCGSCGLRFPPDQNVRYSQHLDWHFRQNRREKANARKALSRKWYYDLSDWIQFAEIEDLEERAQSLFEAQELELENEIRSPGTVLNPDLYTVPSAGHDGAICPQCNEGFESFFDEDKEEWRLRDAHLAESEEPGLMKLYHPICHQDFVAALQGKSSLMDVGKKSEPDQPEPAVEAVPMEIDEAESSASLQEDTSCVDEDEVLILKEGKPEPVVMDILEEDDIVVPESSENYKDPCPSELTKINSGDIESTPSGLHIADSNVDNAEELVDKVLVDDGDNNTEKDSDNQNDETMICIDDDDLEFNNKTDNKEFPSNINDGSNSCIADHNENNSIIDSPAGSNTDNSTSNINNNTAISVSVLSSLEPSGSPPTPITIQDEEDQLLDPLPGISNEDDIFDIVLGNSGQGGMGSNEQEPEKPKVIVYESMKFDIPTAIIKEEPMSDLEDDDSGVKSLDQEISANLGEALPASEVPSEEDNKAKESVDIDLTLEDDDTMDEIISRPGIAAIDGNFLFNTEATVTSLKAPGSKIRIRITDAVLSTDALSPKNTPPHQNEGQGDTATTNVEEKSETTEESDQAKSESVDSVVDGVSSAPCDEQLSVTKPRLAGRKLVNYPPKQTGKEVSGLCTIC